MHVMLGKLDSDEGWLIKDDETGETIESGLGTLPYAGIAVQMNYGSGIFEYGFESGGIISYKNDTAVFAGSSDGGFNGRIYVKNDMRMIDMSLGGYLAVRPTTWLRFYVSAGPSVVWGSMSVDDDDVEIEPYSGGGYRYNPSGRKSDITGSFYARAGFDILFGDDIGIGFSVRKNEYDLDFGDVGEFDLNEPQYLLSFTWEME
jgi:hypothetical protein